MHCFKPCMYVTFKHITFTRVYGDLELRKSALVDRCAKITKLTILKRIARHLMKLLNL